MLSSSAIPDSWSLYIINDKYSSFVSLSNDIISSVSFSAKSDSLSLPDVSSISELNKQTNSVNK